MTLKKLEHVSASQISTHQRCPRKHWLEKIAGVPVPVSAGAEFGSRCHAVVEKRIETGQWPDDPEAVTVAMAGWKYVPQEGTLLVEQDMRLEDAALPIVGRIDLVAPEQSAILDHKFLSSLRYAKTPAELAKDPQAILYCTWALRRGYLSESSIAFRHITYQTKGTPQAVVSQYKFTRLELEEQYARMRIRIEAMARHAAMQEEGAVPSALESDDQSPCKAYGGCPHLARCTAVAGRSVWSNLDKKEDTVNVLEKLAQKKRAQGLDAGSVNPPEAKAVEPPKPVAQPQQTQPEPQQVLFPPSDAEMAEYYAANPPKPQEPTSKMSDPFAMPTIYVGCLPVNENFVLLDHWLAPLQSEAAQTLGVEYYAQAEYGKGKTALAALIIHKAKVEGVPPVLVVDPRLPASETALEILRPKYARIVMRIG